MSAPPPQLSPDGRFYWDGEQWVPMPPAPVLAVRRGRGFGCSLAVILVGLTLLAAGVVLLGYARAHRQPPARPPDFQVLSYDTPSCNESACLVAAVVENHGGPGGGILTITVSDKASGSVLSTCSAQIPNTGTNQESKAECLLSRLATGGRAAGSMDIKAVISHS